MGLPGDRTRDRVNLGLSTTVDELLATVGQHLGLGSPLVELPLKLIHERLNAYLLVDILDDGNRDLKRSVGSVSLEPVS